MLKKFALRDVEKHKIALFEQASLEQHYLFPLSNRSPEHWAEKGGVTSASNINTNDAP